MRWFSYFFIFIFFFAPYSQIQALGDWSVERGEGARGFQSLPLFTGTPKVLSHSLKGTSPSWAISFSAGSADIIIYPDQGGLSAHSSDHIIQWHVNLPLLPDTWLTFSDTGPQRLLAHIEGGSEIYLLDPITGQILWQASVPNKIYAWNVHAGKFIKEIPGQQIVVVSGQGGGDEKAKSTATLFTIDPQFKGRLLWQTLIDQVENGHAIATWPQSTVGDATNDGQNNVVTLIKDGLVVQDIRTGKIQYKSKNIINHDRNYGALYITDLNQDGQNEIIVLADKLAQHIDVLKFNGQGYTLLWSHDHGSSWPQDKEYLHVPGSSAIQNIVDDTKKQIIYSIWTEEKGWCLYIIDSMTGREVVHLPGLFALWSGPILNNGHSQVIALETNTLTPSKYSTVKILDFSKSQPIIWQKNNIHMEGYYGWPLSRPNFLSPHFNYSSQSQYDFVPFLLQRDSQPPMLLFTRDGENMGNVDQLYSLVFDPLKKQFISQPILDLDLATDPQLISAELKEQDDIHFILGKNDKKLNIISTRLGKISEFAGNDSDTPYFYLLSNITGDKKNELLVEHGHFISAFKANKNKNGTIYLQELWQIKGKLLASGSIAHSTITNVIVALAEKNGGMSVAAITGDGKILWKTQLAELSYTTDFEPIYAATLGHFLGHENLDVFIAGRLGPPTGNGDMNISWMLDGKTGKIIWVKKTLEVITNTNTYSLHTVGPDATGTHTGGALALDMNGDGRDELILTSQVLFVVLDGKSGQTLYNPILTSHALQLGHYSSYIWTSYAVLSTLDSLEEMPTILVSSPYVWGSLTFKENILHGLPTPTSSLWQNEGYRPYTLPTIFPNNSKEHDIMTLNGGIHIYSAKNGKQRYQFECPNAGFGSAVWLSEPNTAGLIVTQDVVLGLHQIRNNALQNIWYQRFSATLNEPIVGSFTQPYQSDIIITDKLGNLHILYS